MLLTSSLIRLGVRHLFDVSADHVTAAIETHLTDHSQALPKALVRANNRAWEAVGLALAGDGVFDRVRDLVRSGDMKGVRDQIRTFLNQTPTGFESADSTRRMKASEEWSRLRKSGQLTATIIPGEIAHAAASLDRHASPSHLATAAQDAVRETAVALRAEAPHLAALLTEAPPGGTPLLAAAFAFFLRREIETKAELSRGLTFDSLRHLSERQEAGFALLDGRTAGILDQFDALFEALEESFATTHEKLDELREKLDQFVIKWEVTTRAADPLKVSVTSEAELAQLKKWRDEMRMLPAGLLEARDWSKMGDALSAGGLFGYACEAHTAAARAAEDRSVEAENEFKAFKDALEVTGDWEQAKTSLQTAMRLDNARFRLFDTGRYRLVRIAGNGGFGSVLECIDTIDPHDDGTPRRVAIKSLRRETLDRDPLQVFREARVLKTLHREGGGIIGVRDWGYAYTDPDDPSRNERPYLVLEFFDGFSLDTLVMRDGPLPFPDFIKIARSIAAALHEAHRQGIFHRDLKPSNVMVRRDGTRWVVKVIDFGLAVRRSQSAPQAAQMSTYRDRSLTGSIDFAPPEQRGKLLGVEVGAYSDVFSFGKTCIWLLFRNTVVQPAHWSLVPEAVRPRLRRLLELCTAEDLEPNSILGSATPLRLRSFEPVIAALASLDPDVTALRRQKEAEHLAKLTAEKEKQQAMQLEADKAKQQLIAEEAARRAELAKMKAELEAQRGKARRTTPGRFSLNQKLVLGSMLLIGLGGISVLLLGLAVWNRTAPSREDLTKVPLRTQKDDSKLPPNLGRENSKGELGQDETTYTSKSTGMKFVRIKAGTFRMGSPKDEKDRDGDELAHEVVLTKDYFLGVHEVTQKQYQAVTGKNPSEFKGDDLPVENVSWHEAVAYAKALSEMDGREYRLPTEAEWEYACRGGEKGPYGFAGDDLGDYAWYEKNSHLKTHAVGLKKPNAFGLYDMHGNVLEWCGDWYGDYPVEKVTNPTGPATGSGRVFRGGSRGSTAGYCRSANRIGYGPSSRYYFLGFRLALVP